MRFRMILSAMVIFGMESLFAQSGECESLLSQARQRMDAGDIADAAALFDSVASRCALDPRSNQSRADLAFYEGLAAHLRAMSCGESSPDRQQLMIAQGKYHATLDLDPIQGRAWLNLAETDAVLGKVEAARSEYERAVTVKPSAWYFANYSRFLSGIGDYEAAETRARAALRLEPDSVEGGVALFIAELGRDPRRALQNLWNLRSEVSQCEMISANALTSPDIDTNLRAVIARILLCCLATETYLPAHFPQTSVARSLARSLASNPVSSDSAIAREIFAVHNTNALNLREFPWCTTADRDVVDIASLPSRVDAWRELVLSLGTREKANGHLPEAAAYFRLSMQASLPNHPDEKTIRNLAQVYVAAGNSKATNDLLDYWNEIHGRRPGTSVADLRDEYLFRRDNCEMLSSVGGDPATTNDQWYKTLKQCTMALKLAQEYELQVTAVAPHETFVDAQLLLWLSSAFEHNNDSEKAAHWKVAAANASLVGGNVITAATILKSIGDPASLNADDRKLFADIESAVEARTAH